MSSPNPQPPTSEQASNFFESLWLSIFTPGPTSSLLIATNVAFAALQLVLLLCFIATYSVHFVALSAISGGLWWAINWFAHEVKLAQREQEEAKRREAAAGVTSGSEAEGEDSGAETETAEMETTRGVVRDRAKMGTASGIGTATQIEGESGIGRLRTKGKKSMAESTGSLSTDSEWEKVDEDGDR